METGPDSPALGAANEPGPRTVRAVLFDLDGTLLEQKIDFDALRAELDVPVAQDIIAFLEALPRGRRERAEAILERHERDAAARSRLNAGAAEVLEFLRAEGLPWGVFTRNTRRSVEEAARRHALAPACAVAREDGPPKPSPEPVRRAAAAFGLPARDILAVGDYAFDTESALAAGAVAVFLAADRPPRRTTRAHFVIRSLADLVPLIRRLRSGDRIPRSLRILEADRS